MKLPPNKFSAYAPLSRNIRLLFYNILVKISSSFGKIFSVRNKKILQGAQKGAARTVQRPDFG